jgi:hypothetical protein
MLVREGYGRVAVAKTDRTGIATFQLPGPGRYMVSTTHLHRSDRTDVDWESDSTTLTFAVK